MELQIILHIAELILFLFSLFWVAIRNSRIIQIMPFRIIAILTILITILGGIFICIYDIVLFFNII